MVVRMLSPTVSAVWNWPCDEAETTTLPKNCEYLGLLKMPLPKRWGLRSVHS